MTQAPFEPGRMIDTLVHHGVRFIVIGGIAGRLHGSPRMTRDLDVCYERQPENLGRLEAALRDLDVSLRGAPRDVKFVPDERTLRGGLNFTLLTRWGPFDLLGDASGYTFEILAPNAVTATISGIDVLVVSLDDLIRMKRASGRPQDRADVETLGKLREIREERGLFGLADPMGLVRRGRRAP